MADTTKKTPSGSAKVAEKKTTTTATKGKTASATKKSSVTKAKDQVVPPKSVKTVEKKEKATAAKTVKVVGESSTAKSQKDKSVVGPKASLESTKIDKTETETVSVSSAQKNVEKSANPEVAKEKKFKKMIQIIQVGSSTRRDKKQNLYLKSLGLGKIGKKKELVDSNSVRSLIKKVMHMIKIVE
jgi:large subunit ribosomal protein L30